MRAQDLTEAAVATGAVAWCLDSTPSAEPQPHVPFHLSLYIPIYLCIALRVWDSIISLCILFSPVGSLQVQAEGSPASDERRTGPLSEVLPNSRWLQAWGEGVKNEGLGCRAQG